jgi:hypothetical protein
VTSDPNRVAGVRKVLFHGAVHFSVLTLSFLSVCPRAFANTHLP